MSSAQACSVRDVRLLTPAGHGLPDPRSILFEDGIVAVPGAREGGGPVRAIDGAGRWLLPGWVDIQVNDMEWLAQGRRSPPEHARRVREVAAWQASRGVTGLVLATLAAPREEILDYLRGMRIVLDGGEGRGPADAALLGALVEGTFMNPAYHGAHNPVHVVPPQRALADAFIDTGAVRLLNVAPEMSPRALEVIEHATARGVVVGVGHARPSAERVRAAVEAGLRYVIHLGNGPTGSSLKSFGGGGLLEEALFNDALTVTLIADGYHLDPRLIRDVLARKEPERVIVVSDAGFAMGPPVGDFEVLGVRGRTSPDGEYLAVVPPEDAPSPNPLASDVAPLFGSAADMRRIFETVLNLLTRDMPGIYHRRHPALSLPAALRVASALCSTHPAALLGETDRGHLEPGARADAVLLHVEGSPGAHSVRLERTWLRGVEFPAVG